MKNNSKIKENEKIRDAVILANILAQVRQRHGAHVVAEAIKYEAAVARGAHKNHVVKKTRITSKT